jgi:CRISPR system Cascade subunit CasA
MTDTDFKIPTFNLWRDPWISVESPNGTIDCLGIEQTLLEAHHLTAVYDTSPLVVVGIHRLLMAILQDMLKLTGSKSMLSLWKARQFPVDEIEKFGSCYAHRFDLFSEQWPFLQTNDLPLYPTKDNHLKTIAYLSQDFPCGTGVTHYRHGSESEQVFCPACCASGLVMIPAFATSGGAGIKPSINGVPPMYVIPGGKTLYESLFVSLIPATFLEGRYEAEDDHVWWRRSENLVTRSSEVLTVSYLHSLTLPARRIRLHPVSSEVICTRCGRSTPIGVRTMVFEMGEMRPKDFPVWQDPFTAYKVGQKGLKPVRPQKGKAPWREYASLFLNGQPVQNGNNQENGRTIRPFILEQISELKRLGIGTEDFAHSFRCAGIRTDMKAKIFEWVDSSFSVPDILLGDPTAGIIVKGELELAGECAGILARVFRTHFEKSKTGSERHRHLIEFMLDRYWRCLAEPFRAFILQLAAGNKDEALNSWRKSIYQQGINALVEASQSVGNKAADLRRQIQAQNDAAAQLGKRVERERN